MASDVMRASGLYRFRKPHLVEYPPLGKRNAAVAGKTADGSCGRVRLLKRCLDRAEHIGQEPP
jgi:hypothetical protein